MVVACIYWYSQRARNCGVWIIDLTENADTRQADVVIVNLQLAFQICQHRCFIIDTHNVVLHALELSDQYGFQRVFSLHGHWRYE
jgi:hypothetical protein